LAYNFKSIEDAQNQWAGLDDAGKAAAHDYVVRAKSGSGATYDPATGRWSDQNYSSAPSGQTLRDYANNNNIGVNYNSGTNQVSLSGNGNTMAWNAGNPIAGLQNYNGVNYITDAKAFENSIAGLKAATTQAPTATNPTAQNSYINQDVLTQLQALIDSNYERALSFLPSNTGQSNSATYANDVYTQALADLKTATDPLHQIKLQELQRGEAEAQKVLAAKMAENNAYDSSTMNEQLAKLKSDYLNAAATEDATYESNLATLANGIMQAGLSRESSDNASYNNLVAQLASAYMNGTINLTQFVLDDAYRRAVLAQQATDSFNSTYGVYNPAS